MSALRSVSKGSTDYTNEFFDHMQYITPTSILWTVTSNDIEEKKRLRASLYAERNEKAFLSDRFLEAIREENVLVRDVS